MTLFFPRHDFNLIVLHSFGVDIWWCDFPVSRSLVRRCVQRGEKYASSSVCASVDLAIGQDGGMADNGNTSVDGRYRTDLGHERLPWFTGDSVLKLKHVQSGVSHDITTTTLLH